MKQDIVDALIARIREDYTRLDMRSFRTLSNNGEACAGCLGGNAIALVDPTFMDVVHFPFTPRAGLLEQAAGIMGLSVEAAAELLLPSHWPPSFQYHLQRTPRGSRPYGEMCIKALKMFHENGDQWPPTTDFYPGRWYHRPYGNIKRKTNAT